jgi:NO-binding membrane sensor protein with MHYT domain
VLPLRSFTDGPMIPLLSYVASCVGVFLGLRCATRARACQGAPRGRWLLLAAVCIGSAGIWATDFIALLGFAVSGQTSRYNVLIVIASLLVAIVATGVGMLIIGVDRGEQRALPAGGLIVFGVLLGAGITVSHYLAMAAMRMSARLSYELLLVVLSFLLAVVAATALLLGAVRLRNAWATLWASLGVGLLLCGVHYTAMAAVQMFPASGPAGLIVGGAGGATASSFLLPVILSLSVVVFLVCAAIALSPTEEAMRYDAALLDRIRKHTETPLDVRTTVLRPSRNSAGVPLRNGTPVWNGIAPGQGPAPGQDPAPRPGAASSGTAAGNGFLPDEGYGPGRGTDPGRGIDPGRGTAGPAPPWVLGEFPGQPASELPGQPAPELPGQPAPELPGQPAPELPKRRPDAELPKRRPDAELPKRRPDPELPKRRPNPQGPTPPAR